MFNLELTKAVQRFANLFANSPDSVLELPWQWNGHNEGLRFAFFVVSRELSELTIRLETSLPSASTAQRILAQYHVTFMDLYALLFGLTSEDVNLSPSEKDWPIRRVFAHIVGADIAFFASIQFALEQHWAGIWSSKPMADEDETRLIGMSENEYQALMHGSFENLMSFHDKFHASIIKQFSSISEEELDLPAIFWEPVAFPIRYRLHRYEAHLRQHIIQIEKTLTSIDLAPSETRQLIRMLLTSLAKTDGAYLNPSETGWVICQKTTDYINSLAGEITPLIPVSPNKAP